MTGEKYGNYFYLGEMGIKVCGILTKYLTGHFSRPWESPGQALHHLFCFGFASTLPLLPFLCFCLIRADTCPCWSKPLLISFKLSLHSICHPDVLPHIMVFFLALFGYYRTCYLLNIFHYSSSSTVLHIKWAELLSNFLLHLHCPLTP